MSAIAASEFPDRVQRGRRRHAVLFSRRRSVYDWVAIVLLSLPALVGPFLFGSVRLWSICPLMFLSAFGAGLCFLRAYVARDEGGLKIPPAGGLFLLLAVYMLVRYRFAPVPFDAKVDLLKTASVIFAYWGWFQVGGAHNRWRWLFAALLMAVTLIGWYAIIQHANGSRMVLNMERPDQYEMRASGTYMCPNHFANLIEIVLPLALALMLSHSAGWPLRLLSGYSLVVLLPVMVLTESRSGWVATVVGLGTALLAIAWRRSRRWFLAALLLGALAVAGAGVGLWTFSDRIRERIEGASLDKPDSAVAVRLEMWSDSLPEIRRNPVWGYGGFTFRWLYPTYRTTNRQLLFRYMHNEFLQFIFEYGVVGFLLASAATGWLIFKLLALILRGERDRDAHLAAGALGALAACAVHALFDFNFHIFSNVHMLTAVVGISVVVGVSSVWMPPTEPLRGRRALLPGVFAAAAAVLMAFAVQTFLSYGYHHLGERDREMFKMDSAFGKFERSARIDPSNWQAYLGQAHVRQAEAFWSWNDDEKEQKAEEAIALYESAAAQNPLDMEIAFGMAKSYNALGEPEKALEQLRKAAKADPYHLFYVPHLGLQLRRMGRYAEAYEVFRDTRDRIGDSDMVRINLDLLKDHAPSSADETPEP